MLEGEASLRAEIARLTEELADAKKHAKAAETECERLREKLWGFSDPVAA